MKLPGITGMLPGNMKIKALRFFEYKKAAINRFAWFIGLYCISLCLVAGVTYLIKYFLFSG